MAGVDAPVYIHGCFEEEILERLRGIMHDVPPSKCSKNMYATRYFFRDAELAAELCARLPRALRVEGICSDMRIISYPVGGFIAPHVDGVRVDDVTGRQTTTSFLLYLADIPEGEGGETEFLDRLADWASGDGHDDGREPVVTRTIVPRAGSILIFPHGSPHQGNGVGSYPKLLLRGDCF